MYKRSLFSEPWRAKTLFFQPSLNDNFATKYSDIWKLKYSNICKHQALASLVDGRAKQITVTLQGKPCSWYFCQWLCKMLSLLIIKKYCDRKLSFKRVAHYFFFEDHDNFFFAKRCTGQFLFLHVTHRGSQLSFWSKNVMSSSIAFDSKVNICTIWKNPIL